MARNRFTDPNTGKIYDWAINHTDEGQFGKTRQITESANTANTGLIKQQSDTGPLIIKVTGTILHKHQIEEMIAWYQLCESQTIFFKDFAGEEYEVIITGFQPVRKRTVKNPRDFANMPLWYFSYELDMEVITVRSGIWAGVTA